MAKKAPDSKKKAAAAKRDGSSVDRRQAIIQAAVTCYIQNGIAQTRSREIAIEAGVDQPLVNYYFHDFESLFKEVVAFVLDDLRSATVQKVKAAGEDPVQALINYVHVPFEWSIRSPGHFTIWLYFYHIASFVEDFTQIDRAIREAGRERIRMILYSGIEKGVFKLPKGSNVTDTALNIQGLITGNTIMAATENRSRIKDFANITERQILAWVQDLQS